MIAAAARRHSLRLRRARRAFTLVEVMISVALVLILIIGINQAFKMVTDTVGAGQTLSALVRDNRAIQPVLYGDMRGMVTQNSPAFIIAASRVNAFRNRTDEQGDKDGNPLTIDLDNNNAEGEPTVLGEVISPAKYNERSHRTDRLAFFARDQYRRQTGNLGTFSNSMTGGEAYVWYGHLRLRNNAAASAADDLNYIQPGVFDPAITFAANPNNFHAANFALGRMVVMLKGDEDPGPGSVIRDNAIPAVAQEHIIEVAAAPAGYLSPLTWGSPATDGTHFVQESRFDLAATTIADFYADVQGVAGQPHAIPVVPTVEATWWLRLLYTSAVGYSTPPTASPARIDDYRFAGNRFFARPLDAAKAARVAPILANGCSQFIVEFAGDYITQTSVPGDTTDGEILSDDPDGVIDFIVDSSYGTFERRTRWYGMPRDTAGNTGRNGANQFVGGADGRILLTGGPNIAGPDVLPVRDVRASARTPAVRPAGYVSFERNIANELIAPGGGDYLATGGMDPNARYTCVWGPDVNPTTDPLPQQLRITIVLDEPAGRLAEGQTYEYVIDLP